MESGVLCEQWSAHRALFLGLLNQIVPALVLDGAWIPNPLVITDRMTDEYGNLVFGLFKTGAERDASRQILARARPDLKRLDEDVERLCTRVLLLIPECVMTMIHYFSHRLAWLWKFHSIHHGVQRLYGFNGFVRHPLHQTLDIAFGTLCAGGLSRALSWIPRPSMT